MFLCNTDFIRCKKRGATKKKDYLHITKGHKKQSQTLEQGNILSGYHFHASY